MSREGCHGSVGGCVQVSLRNAQPHRRAIRVAGENQRAAGCHDDQIAVGVGRLGPVLSERRDRNVDERGIDFREIGETEIVLRQVAGIVRLDQKISALDEAAQQIAAGVALEVESDRALVAIVRPPIQRTIWVRRVLVERPDIARSASAHRLDLDHVGAHVGEHLAA